MRGIYIDTETGGLDAKVHGLVSVGAVAFEIDVINPVKYTILDSYIGYIKPVRTSYGVRCLEYSIEAEAIHGIGLDWLEANGQPEAEIHSDLVSFIQKYLQPDEPFAGRLWAHNAPFDHGFVKAMENRVFVCTSGEGMMFHDRCDWSCTKNLWCVLRGLGVHNVRCKLDDIIDHYGIVDPRGGQHNALTDAMLGIEVLRHMLFDLKRHYDVVQ